MPYIRDRMKLLQFVAVGLLASMLFTSCKKEDDKGDPIADPYGKLTVSIANEIDGQPLVFGPMSYTNASGNKYSVDLLKYYVSNFTLVKADGSETNFKNYQLIDASVPSTLSFTLDSVLNGEYTSVKFFLGVDSVRNHTGVQEGALDPVHGMIWTWNTGYIFFKHEGFYQDSTGATRTIVFHLGTDDALTSITVPITKLAIAGNSRKLFLDFNLNSAYTSAVGNMDFNFENFRMSGRDDFFWIRDMKSNLADAFSYNKAE
jgi:hypothetical protein